MDCKDREDAPRLSLAAKWAPRESKGNWKRMAKVLALYMEGAPASTPKLVYSAGELSALNNEGRKLTSRPSAIEGECQTCAKPGKSGRHSKSVFSKGLKFALMKCRKKVSKLNEVLNTCEVKMCRHEWSTINPASVSSRCMMRNRKALMNNGETPSEDPDRVACAAKFQMHLAKGKSLHGGALHANEIVGEYYLGQEEDAAMEAQWKDLRKQFQFGDGAKYVAMADVSGSMTCSCDIKTSPMVCCLALSILISEISHPVFQNRVLTFESNPKWFNLRGSDTLKKKVDHLKSAPWGGSTNFYGAMKLLCDSCVQAGLTEEELPKGLVIFSDMQFDCASEETQTSCVSKISGLWQMHGYTTYPKIIFWNLASRSSFPATGQTENVQMLSGFSQNLMHSFLNDEELDTTPEAALRNLLDEKWLEGVRDAFNSGSNSLDDPSLARRRKRVRCILSSLKQSDRERKVTRNVHPNASWNADPRHA